MWKHFHSLKIRTAGANTFIKFNIHLESDLSLRQVHELCDKIEKELNTLIARSEVYIHAEPQDLYHIQTEENLLCRYQSTNSVQKVTGRNLMDFFGKAAILLKAFLSLVTEHLGIS